MNEVLINCNNIIDNGALFIKNDIIINYREDT